MAVTNREKLAEVMIKDAASDKADADEKRAEAEEMQAQVALQIQQLNEYARTVREREVRITAREEEVEERETLLESATRALSARWGNSLKTSETRSDGPKIANQRMISKRCRV